MKTNTQNGPTNHQRHGAVSNAHVGREFEELARIYLSKTEGELLPVRVPLGIGDKKKDHTFDLGNAELLVECKSHNWTESGKLPSAKLTVWNEAMYLFQLAPSNFRKVLFVLKAAHPRQRETLAQFYVRTNGHLIPDGVSIVEFDAVAGIAEVVTI